MSVMEKREAALEPPKIAPWLVIPYEREAALKLPDTAPWLVIPYGEGKLKHALYNIFEPDNTNCRKFFIQELSGKTFWQKPSHQGWLIVLCDVKDDNSMTNCKYGDFFLWNPLTLETIQLPSLLNLITSDPDKYLLDCVLSSPPKNNDVDSINDSDPLVLVMYTTVSNFGNYTFLFCHPREKQWRSQLFSEEINGHIYELEYVQCFKGKLYAIGINGDFLEIEKQHQVNTSLSLKKFHVREDWNIVPFHGAKDVFKERPYFVQGHDDLFMILVHFNHKGFHDTNPVVISIFVTRLNFSLMKWQLVNNLGDDVLFIGRKNSVCCSAAKLGLPRGCLYYTLPFDEPFHTMGAIISFSSKDVGLYKFEVENNGDYDISPCLRLLEPVFAPDWIMMPERKEGKLGINEEDQDYISKALENKLSITCDNANSSLCVRPNAQENTPWLLFSRDNRCTVYNLVNPMHENENYLVNFSEFLLGATIRFQNGGWLLMSRKVKLFFYNPFTREIIILPDFPGRYNMSDISFTSTPTSSDCIVFATEGRVEEYRDSKIYIHCIKRGNREWDFFSFNVREYWPYSPLRNTPISFHGDLYSVGYDGDLVKLDLKDDGYWETIVENLEFNDSYPSFLAECGDDLLLVKLGGLKTPVRIFRLDFAEMEWVKVESLGKHMLFISGITCFSAVAPSRRMENKVYFPRLCLNGEGVLFYSLETGRYHSFGSQHFAKNFCGTQGWFRNCSWIEPNWAKSTPQELDWLKPPSLP